jgi:hypothetical protein
MTELLLIKRLSRKRGNVFAAYALYNLTVLDGLYVTTTNCVSFTGQLYGNGISINFELSCTPRPAEHVPSTHTLLQVSTCS